MTAALRTDAGRESFCGDRGSAPRVLSVVGGRAGKVEDHRVLATAVMSFNRVCRPVRQSSKPDTTFSRAIRAENDCRCTGFCSLLVEGSIRRW
jgi:hypothetical protein